MKILIVGDGKMGAVLKERAALKNVGIVGVIGADGGFERYWRKDIDCVVDFSHDVLTRRAVDFCIDNFLPLVTGTTALSKKTKDGLARLAQVSAVCASENFSAGVAALRAALKKVLKVLPDFDVEIVEKHRRDKADAPSGTAKMLMRCVAEERKTAEFVFGRRDGKLNKNQAGVHSLRGGTVIGKHEVCFLGDGESITIEHEAWDRSVFADGALVAAEKILGKIGFFRYDELNEVNNG